MQQQAPSANPGPLGLMGFGMTTVLLNIHNAGFFPISAMIMAMGIFYGGISQILVGLMEFKNGNTFAGTTFTSYGFFWLTLVTIWLLPTLGLAEATPPSFMGWYLALWGIFTFGMFFGTLRGPIMLKVVFGGLAILYFLLAIHNWTGSKLIGTIAGFEGIFCGASAIYLSIAEVLHGQYGKKVLPY